MTIQTCCGDIASNDPNVRESDFPYMTRHCYDTDSWSSTECSKNCCGDSDATCTPTREGGYCMRDGSFYKYRSSPTGTTRVNLTRNAAFQETEYQRRHPRDPTYPTTNWHNRARYRDMKRRVLSDMRNEQMNVGILHQKKPGDFPRIPEEEYESIFQVSEGVTVLLGFLGIALLGCLFYVLSRYLKP